MSTEWLDRYKARLIARGVDPEAAQACTDAEREEIQNGMCDCALTDPEDAADDEISYMTDDET